MALDFDPISLVEQCYLHAPGPEVWAAQMIEPLSLALGLQGDAPMASYTVDPRGVPQRPLAARAGAHLPTLGDVFEDICRTYERFPQPSRQSFGRAVTTLGLTSYLDATGGEPDCDASPGERLLDGAIVGYHEKHGTSAVFIALTPERYSVDAPSRALWRKLSTHLSAGCRLAQRDASPEAEDVECVLTSGGTVVQACGKGRAREARAELREAVRNLDRARTRRGRADPEAALELWRGLFSGRWSLVDHFDSDGKRFLLARRNEPHLPAPSPLPLRQRQALFYASSGWSNKEIAYALGVSTTTIATHLHRGLRRLNIGSREQWIRMAAEITAAAVQCSEGHTGSSAAGTEPAPCEGRELHRGDGPAFDPRPLGHDTDCP